MIIRLNVNGLEALGLMETLKLNGYNPVMTIKDLEGPDKVAVYPYTVSFDTAGPEEYICLGDCDDCPNCTPECEEWYNCCRGAEMHEPIKETTSCDNDCNTCMCYDEDCEYWDTCWHAVKRDNKDKNQLDYEKLYKILDSIVTSAKNNSRILNE